MFEFQIVKSDPYGTRNARGVRPLTFDADAAAVLEKQEVQFGTVVRCPVVRVIGMHGLEHFLDGVAFPLGKVPGQEGVFGDMVREPHNEPVPGLLILRLDAPLYFFNANVARKGILDLVAAGKDLRAVILDIGATTDLDLASVDMLRELVDSLSENRIVILFSHVGGPVRDRMEITGLTHHMGEDKIFLSLDFAVRDYHRRFPDQGNVS